MSSCMAKTGGAKCNNNSKKMKGGDFGETLPLSGSDGGNDLNKKVRGLREFTYENDISIPLVKTQETITNLMKGFEQKKSTILTSLNRITTEEGNTIMSIADYESSNINTKIAWAYDSYRTTDSKYNFLTVFSHLLDENELKVANNWMLFLNAQIPYPEFSAVPPTAGMCYAHLLAVPIRPIYNTVSLSSKPGIYNEISMVKNIITKLMDNQDFRNAVIKGVDEICFGSENSKPRRIVPQKEGSDEDIRKKLNEHATNFRTMTGNDMTYYVHLHPTHSVDQLHIHCLQPLLKTSNAHDNKNVPLDIVMEALKNFPVAMQTLTGGKKNSNNNAKDLKKTDEKVKVGGRELTVHVNKRGTKHVKRGGEFVNLNKALKDAAKKNNNKK